MNDISRWFYIWCDCWDVHTKDRVIMKPDCWVCPNCSNVYKKLPRNGYDPRCGCTDLPDCSPTVLTPMYSRESLIAELDRRIKEHRELSKGHPMSSMSDDIFESKMADELTSLRTALEGGGE